jgi:hypothetical protein
MTAFLASESSSSASPDASLNVEVSEAAIVSDCAAGCNWMDTGGSN